MSPTSQRRLLKILLNISVCIFFYYTKFYWILGIAAIALLWRFIVLYLEFRTERNLRAQIKGFQIPAKRTDKNILLLVNPNAGGGKAKRLLERVVKPMLTKAKVQYNTLLTQRQGHAGEICKELGRKILDGTCEYQVIACVSGDGMLHETINGLIQGYEPDSAHNKNQPGSSAVRELFKRVSVGIVPAGSGNGVAHSIGCGDPYQATLTLITGEAQPLDLFSISSEQAPRAVFDAHFFCWANFAQHDYLMEHSLRFFGPDTKKILAPLAVFITNKSWAGRAELELAEMTEEERRAGYYSDPSQLPLLSNGMRELRGNFRTFACANLSMGASDAILAPTVKQSEGAVDLLCCKQDGVHDGIWPLIRLFLKTESGEHVQLSYLDTYKIKRMKFQPLAKCHMQCSGEEQPNTDIELLVHKGLGSIICPTK